MEQKLKQVHNCQLTRIFNSMFYKININASQTNSLAEKMALVVLKIVDDEQGPRLILTKLFNS